MKSFNRCPMVDRGAGDRVDSRTAFFTVFTDKEVPRIRTYVAPMEDDNRLLSALLLLAVSLTTLRGDGCRARW